MQRQILLDTETTGLDPKERHRVIEIGCVELISRKYTNNNFHYYINPERDVENGAFEVHGISNEFLKDKPIFRQISDKFINYIKGAELIAHNAPFDVGFLNHELELNGYDFKISDICKITDSLQIAKTLYPGQKNNLDILCKRNNISTVNRTLHGALLDARLLAEVYLAMTGGQTKFVFDDTDNSSIINSNTNLGKNIKTQEYPKDLVVLRANSQELNVHKDYIDLLKKKNSKNIELWEE